MYRCIQKCYIREKMWKKGELLLDDQVPAMKHALCHFEEIARDASDATVPEDSDTSFSPKPFARSEEKPAARADDYFGAAKKK